MRLPVLSRGLEAGFAQAEVGDELLHELFYPHYRFYFRDVAAAEEEAVFPVAAVGADERVGYAESLVLELADAVREAAGAAGHLAESVGEVAFEQRAHDRASGQAAWALEQHDVAIVRVYVGFLEALGGVALLCRGEARAHLDAACAELYRLVYVLRVPDAAGCDYGDAEAEVADVFH